MMTRFDLIPHPDTPQPDLRLDAMLIPAGVSGLAVNFRLFGDCAALRHPSPATPQRRDELWRQTCFEVFVRCPHAAAYREFNFSPSEAWQAYDFDAYRKGRREAAVQPPQTSWAIAPDQLNLHVLLRPEQLPPGLRLRLGLAAVVEHRHGLSYWALSHPTPHPDFHHPDAFAIEIDLTP